MPFGFIALYWVPVTVSTATSKRYAQERGVAQGLQFQHIVGVVLQEDKQALERMIFRISRGNCYVRFSNIEEPLQVTLPVPL